MKKIATILAILLLMSLLGTAQEQNRNNRYIDKLGISFGGGASSSMNGNGLKPYLSVLLTTKEELNAKIKFRTDIGYMLSQSEHLTETYYMPFHTEHSNKTTYTSHGIYASAGLKIKPFKDELSPYFYAGLNFCFSIKVNGKPNSNLAYNYNNNSFGFNTAIGADLSRTVFYELWYSQSLVHFGAYKINFIGVTIGFYFQR